MKPICYILSGIPGSGKSTYSKWLVKNTNNTIKRISRDEIRFSMLKPEDDYFAYEDKVIKEFYRQINDNLALGYDVIADATHISNKALKRLMRNIHVNCNYILISFDIDVLDCMIHNNMREGREYVPSNVISRMNTSKKYFDLDVDESLFIEHWHITSEMIERIL